MEKDIVNKVLTSAGSGNVERFTGTQEVSELLDQITEEGLDRKIYSDIIDEQGNQYVDLVQEGGGVLGIALTGYTWILEKAGIRFFSLAGTSAGAINTLMIACCSRIGEPVSEKILEILAEKDLSELVDGNSRIRKLIRRYIKDKPCFMFFVITNLIMLWRIMKRHLGINPGSDFEKWITGELSRNNINTLSDLKELRSHVPQLLDRSENNIPISRKAVIQIIASDITSKSKIVFPEMAELYWKEPENVNPAKFVRASMSIPFFFYPFVVGNIPGAGGLEDPETPKEETKWWKHAGYRGRIPDKVRFVDGGMLSNFPINAFHLSAGVPKKPTFGVKLSTWREEVSKTDKPGGMIGAMVNTMRQLHDYDFLRKNPDYNSLICHIDADESFNWLDFYMPAEKQVELFLLGAQKAVEFLEKFKWEEYKKIRMGKQVE